MVTYTVPAGRYNSTTSQGAADALATADVTANKQTYANTNGSCSPTAQVTYYNVQKSGTATRNNCGYCYRGQSVTYIVSAGTYTSIISQVDADNKANNDVRANKQAYANATGGCNPK